MGVFELVLLLIAAVLASSLLSQLSSRISTPLVQIAIGVVIALFVDGGIHVDVDPELFLVLFIAPLLFNEANHMDKLGFWKNKGMILSLALGLVVATTLAVGFAVNALAPSIPLAAAFALGAALGPTDAVAVASMSGVAKLSMKQKSILSGESLINDASGLVAFQFAAAAAVTGTFSIVDAGGEFLVTFCGGLALGAVVGAFLNLFMSFVRSVGLENRTFHVLFEVAVPFGTFMLGEHLGVSGVLAVVACGIVFSISYKQTGPQTSKMNIVSSSVWDVITFALNGIVFVLLGMMLPGGMMSELENETRTLDFDLLWIAAVATIVVIGARFVWTLLVERVFGSADEINRGLVKHSAILAFAGAKGAITLSIIMSMTSAIAAKSQLVFIASVVILATLLLANFVVPVLAPAGEPDADKERKTMLCYVKILRGVIGRLSVDEEDAESEAEKLAYQSVIDEYAALVVEVQSRSGLDDDKVSRMLSLRIEALEWQKECAEDKLVQGEYGSEPVKELVASLDERQDKLESGSRAKWTLVRAFRRIKTIARTAAKAMGASKLLLHQHSDYKQLSRECQEYALRRLEGGMSTPGEWTAEEYSMLATEYRNTLLSMNTTPMSMTQFIKSGNMADEIRLRALHYEHALLDEAYSNKEIDRHSTNVLRRQISAMQLDVAGEL